MRLLLDTHAFLWAAGDPEQLRPEPRSAIEDAANDVPVSAGVAWEIMMNVAFGKLKVRSVTRREVFCCS